MDWYAVIIYSIGLEAIRTRRVRRLVRSSLINGCSDWQISHGADLASAAVRCGNYSWRSRGAPRRFRRKCLAHRIPPSRRGMRWASKISFGALDFGVFQGSCRVNHPTMRLASRAVVLDQGSAARYQSAPSCECVLTIAPDSCFERAHRVRGAGQGFACPDLDDALLA